MLQHIVRTSFIRSLFLVYFSQSALIVSRLGPSWLALFPFAGSTLCFSISGILALEFRFAELYYRLALYLFSDPCRTYVLCVLYVCTVCTVLCVLYVLYCVYYIQ